ncbi:MAG: NAD(P)/FAD-dependent oxidoreductase [Asgard group archaeon]|nr:NAD(P)/FAD-dependent oxidoreductase [Asgard group archaeon]
MSTKNKGNYYDVIIVGAGPAGAVCAFYLAQMGRNILLLDKKKFPRDKICGDAFPLRAQMHLERMGVLQELIKEKKGRFAALGGIVSPKGIEYYGDSHQELNEHLVIAVKRRIIDEKMVNAAKKAGTILVENYSVDKLEFNVKNQIWKIGSSKNDIIYNSKLLILADGAPSQLGRKLGLIKTAPQATCSRAYIEAGSHNFDKDGVCYYPSILVPGYCALFKEADGDVVYCCYIIPGGKSKVGDLVNLHHTLIKEDPYMSKAIGPNPKMEKMKAAPIRFGGVKKSYADNLLIIGDAAGQIDPLTGEGLQYAMDAAEIAAKTIDKALKRKKYNKRFLKQYQRKWMKSFGRDFKWSSRMIKFIVKFPIFLDAFASLSNKKGDEFMVEWGKIMTGSKAKINFFLPNLAFPLLLEALKLRRKNKRKSK